MRDCDMMLFSKLNVSFTWPPAELRQVHILKLIEKRFETIYTKCAQQMKKEETFVSMYKGKKGEKEMRTTKVSCSDDACCW